MAQHSFQVLMPNSPFLLDYLCFGTSFFTRVKVNQRSIYSRILARVRAVAMAMELVKNKAYKSDFCDRSFAWFVNYFLPNVLKF